jgi:hypothetical protein
VILEERFQLVLACYLERSPQSSVCALLTKRLSAASPDLEQRARLCLFGRNIPGAEPGRQLIDTSKAYPNLKIQFNGTLPLC